MQPTLADNTAEGAHLNLVNAGAGAVGDGGVNFGDHGNAPLPAYPGGLVWIVVNPEDASTGYHCLARSRDVARTSHYQQVRRQLPVVEQYWV